MTSGTLLDYNVTLCCHQASTGKPDDQNDACFQGYGEMRNNHKRKGQAIRALVELRRADAELETKETMREPGRSYLAGLRNREAEEILKWYRETQGGRCPRCTAAGFSGRLIFDESGPVCINCAWRPGPGEVLSLVS